MGISTYIDFEIIDPTEGSKSFPALVGQSWGRKMNDSISLEKDRIKLKGEGKRVSAPIQLSQGKPWAKPDDNDSDISQLYQIVQNNEYCLKHNKYGEIHLG